MILSPKWLFLATTDEETLKLSKNHALALILTADKPQTNTYFQFRREYY